MQKSYERFSSEVLDAASAPVRLHILKLLTSKGPLPYTEIMYEAKLDPIRDAGKFVYHLKTLRKAGLVANEKGTKKYSITELGKILVNFSRDLEEYAAVRRGRLFVRTSKMTIEEFDRSRIARSLVTEAGMPQSLASEIASEAEERLLRFGTTYLTAPLIRELVNTILVERKLEEYRHKLTRLGLPVNDVTMLLRDAGQKHLDSGWVEKAAGTAVTEEYVLLQALPKSLADAHLSGRIHLEETESWILKPSQFFHDPRPFLQRGLPGVEAPSSLDTALGLVLRLARIGEREVSEEQVFDHFNTCLAPYVKGVPAERVQEALGIFLQSLNWDGFSNVPQPKVSLSLDRQVPKHLQGQPAFGPHGRKEGVYGDFSREAEEVFRTIVSVAVQNAGRSLIVNPAITVRLSRDGLSEQDELLRLVHQVSANSSLPNYLVQDEDEYSVSSEGCVFSTGAADGHATRGPILGTVMVNLPRAAYEASGKDERFLQNVQSAASEAVEALSLRYSAVKERIKEGLLPMLSSQPDGSPYFGHRNAAGEVGLTGLWEAMKHQTRSDLGEKDSLPLAKRIVDAVRRGIDEADTHGLRVGVGLHSSGEASSRLAGVDAEKFGFSTIVYQGSKKYPYYTDVPAVPPAQKMTLAGRISLEAELQKGLDGGTIVPLRIREKTEVSVLSRITRQLGEAGVKHFTYGGLHTVCRQCHQLGPGNQTKCEKCGSDQLTVLGKLSGRTLPLELWPEARRRDLDRIMSYDVT